MKRFPSFGEHGKAGAARPAEHFEQKYKEVEGRGRR